MEVFCDNCGANRRCRTKNRGDDPCSGFLTSGPSTTEIAKSHPSRPAYELNMASPADQKVQRRLAAILAADVVGFSALMGVDEEGTVERIKSLRREVLEPMVADHQGRIVKTTGDGFLVEFSSSVEAVRFSVEI